MNRILRILLGGTFIIVGLASIFIPFLPGLLFIVVGLVICGNSRARIALHTMRHKLADWVGPKTARWVLPPHLEPSRKTYKR